MIHLTTLTSQKLNTDARVQGSKELLQRKSFSMQKKPMPAAPMIIDVIKNLSKSITHQLVKTLLVNLFRMKVWLQTMLHSML
jgi:hypothetical protein